MKHGKLRIAWSMGWGIVGMLLVALWVRSYWRWDRVVKPQTVVFESIRGQVGVNNYPPYTQPWSQRWFLITYPGITEAYAIWQESAPHPRKLGFDFTWNKDEHGVAIPFWFLVMIAATSAVIPWVRQLRWRFSLRTLLVATTLVAVGLGTVIFLTR
jgi:hypothetical protein